MNPLQPADLPKRSLPFWKMTGPGAVLVGLSIGAGEIVVWPRVAAEFGPGMVWAAVVGVFLQMWLNFEIGRWTIATGESVYTGFARVWRHFGAIFVGFNICGWILPAWARASGQALRALVVGPAHPSPDWLWTALTFAAVLLMLFGPRHVYSAVEKSVEAMVVIVVVGLCLIAIRFGTAEAVGDLARGVVNVGWRDPAYGVKDLFSAMVFAGAGGTANLFYTFYLRDKHVGMGARVPELVNPFRGRSEKVPQTGFAYPETEENARTFRDWFRYVVLDQALYFWLLNSFTILLFIFGALVVLRPAGVVPSAGSLIYDQAEILGRSMGAFGRVLFLVIGLATLFSTQITLTDGVSRSLSDILSTTYGLASRVRPERIYLATALFIVVFGVGLTAFMEARQVTALGFLFNAGYVGGFAMAVYTPLLLWLNLRHLPPSARPGPVHVAMMCVATLVYTGFAIVCLWSEIAG